MPRIVVRIDAGITHEIIRREAPPPAAEPGARNLRSGTMQNAVVVRTG